MISSIIYASYLLISRLLTAFISLFCILNVKKFILFLGFLSIVQRLRSTIFIVVIFLIFIIRIGNIFWIDYKGLVNRSILRSNRALNQRQILASIFFLLLLRQLQMNTFIPKSVIIFKNLNPVF